MKLLFGRKTLTNLDSILKSKDFTLLTKIQIIKAMIFQVVMYRCESWAIKKAECMPKNWCFRTVVLEKILESSFDSKESNQSILKEINPGNPLEGLMLKLKLYTLATWCKELTHWKRPWCWERLRAGGEGATEEEMVIYHHWLNGHEFEQTPGDSGKQRSLACCSPWGHKELDTTQQLNNNNIIYIYI